MVGAAGFEPTTLCPPDRCATRLRYAPTDGVVSAFFVEAQVQSLVVQRNNQDSFKSRNLAYCEMG